MTFLISLWLLFTPAQALNMSCDVVRQYSLAQLRAMAKQHNIKVTKRQRQYVMNCFKKK